MKRLAITFALLINSPALALVGNGQEKGDRFNLTDDKQTSTILLSDQYQNGLSLHDESIIGSYGLQAKEILDKLAPNLSGCTLRLSDIKTGGDASTVHEYYDMYFAGYRIHNVYLSIHHHNNKLVMVRLNGPQIELPLEKPNDDNFTELDQFGTFFTPETDLIKSEKIIAISSDIFVAAWLVHYHDRTVGETFEAVIDGESGKTLSEHSTAFRLADVFNSNEEITTVELPDLLGSGYLDGTNFTVFAPEHSDPRVNGEHFSFSPDDTVEFDQVQSYYNAVLALAWFEKFDYQLSPSHIVIHTNAIIDGKVDNAQYLPPPEGPALYLGKGGETLENLGRDADVITHELSHHIIYRRLTTTRGETGILHEGMADYFTYAITGDPYLGETIIPGSPWLRTAKLNDSVRYDNPSNEQSSHYLGQIFSAVLWDVREKIGDRMDKIVYESIDYMGSSSGFTDAFVAILSADRDNNPLEEDNVEFGLYGSNKCFLIDAGIRRGFASYMENLDADSCGLDMVQLAQESREYTDSLDPEPKTKGSFSLKIAGRTCAVVGEEQNRSQIFFLLLLFVVPIVLTLGFSRLGKGA